MAVVWKKNKQDQIDQIWSNVSNTVGVEPRMSLIGVLAIFFAITITIGHFPWPGRIPSSQSRIGAIPITLVINYISIRSGYISLMIDNMAADKPILG